MLFKKSDTNKNKFESMNKPSFSLLLTGICTGVFSLVTMNAMANSTPRKPYWQDVQVVAVNKEYPRTAFMTYDNRTDALTGKYENSKYYQLLNGDWKFFFVDSYKKLPENITDPSVSTASWNDIKVPGVRSSYIYESRI